jgi:preprotein translocase subunit SecD
MARRENFLFLFVIILLALALCIVLPTNGGVLGNKGFQYGLDISGGSRLLYSADLSKKDPSMSVGDVMNTVKATIERRVNGLGVTEPIIQVQGNNLLVELPNVKNVKDAIDIIGQVALLEFKEQKLDDAGNVVKDNQGNPEWIPSTATGSDGTQKALTGALLKPNAYVTVGDKNAPVVAFEWNAEGATMFSEITTRLLNKPLGIFLDNALISAPIVNNVISAKGVIEGLTLDNAKKLAIELNSGTLSVPLQVIAQTDVSASLGKDSLDKSIRAGLIGISCVAFFMIIYYRLPGFVAAVALAIYASIVLAIFKLIPGFTLTLPGIAGFVISTGMAVDANVLIFERMKEEFKRGLTLKMAVAEGFHRAWPSIRDSNFSTLITCVILFWFGNTFGAATVKGFAITLAIGVLVSLFSAITVTRTFLTQLVNNGLMKGLTLYGVKHD